MCRNAWLCVALAITFVFIPQKLSAGACHIQNGIPSTVAVQWNWILQEDFEPGSSYYEYFKHMFNMSLVVMKRGFSDWLVVNLEASSEKLPEMHELNVYSEICRCRRSAAGGNLTITSLPSNIFPEKFLQTFPLALTLNANGLNIRQFERDDFSGANLLKHVNFSNNNILMVPSTAFKYAINLKTIDMSYNNIEMIHKYAFDENELTYVDHFEMRPMRIKSAPVPSITEIYLHNNNLTNITKGIFKNLINLEILTLHNNFIQNIDGNEFIFNNKLRILNLHRNSLIHLENMQQMPKPINFTINENPNMLSSVSIKAINIDLSNTNTTHCSIHPTNDIFIATNNKIEFILLDDPGQLFRLRLLNLSHNQINSISNISGFTELETLDLSYNDITKIDSAYLTNLHKLHELNISNNKIKKLDLSFLTKTVSMEYLNIAYNQLGVFQLNVRAEKLTTLKIDGNGLSVIDTNMKQMAPEMKYIGLADNNWDCRHLTTSLLLLHYDGIYAITKAEDQNTQLNDENATIGNFKGIHCTNSVNDNKELSHTASPDTGHSNEMMNIVDERLNKLETKLLNIFNMTLIQTLAKQIEGASSPSNIVPEP